MSEFAHDHEQKTRLLAEIRALETERDAAIANAAQYRRSLEAVAHFWRNDPLAFGDEATPTTLAGRFTDIGQLCCATLEVTTAGAQLLVEHTAYRVALDAARHALLSYAYGNSAPGPALDTAEYIEETLAGRGRAIDDARKARKS